MRSSFGASFNASSKYLKSFIRRRAIGQSRDEGTRDADDLEMPAAHRCEQQRIFRLDGESVLQRFLGLTGQAFALRLHQPDETSFITQHRRQIDFRQHGFRIGGHGFAHDRLGFVHAIQTWRNTQRHIRHRCTRRDRKAFRCFLRFARSNRLIVFAIAPQIERRGRQQLVRQARAARSAFARKSAMLRKARTP